MKSIIQDDKSYCYIHRKLFGMTVKATDEHHMLHGTSRRKLAEEDGLKCYLCRTCHSAIHDRGLYDKALQKEAQQKWMEYNGKSVADFIKRYGKSYL